MIKKSLLLIALSAISLLSFSQQDRILGYWYTEEGSSQLEIYKSSNGKYWGNIIWLTNENKYKKDERNPDEKLRSRAILGLTVLSHLTYNAETKEWTQGIIYDPNSGKTYDCYAWFDDNNYEVLRLKGYVLGLRFIGRSTVWRREKEKRL